MLYSFMIWLTGILTGIGGYKLYELIKAQKLELKWFHWIIGVLWYLTGIFVIGFVGTSFYEGEPQAAGMAILIFGGFFLVVSVILYRFIYKKQAKTTSQKEVTA